MTGNERIKATVWRAIDRLAIAERRKDYAEVAKTRAHVDRLLDAALGIDP